MDVWGDDLDSKDPNEWGSEAFAGTILYAGGYSSRLDLALPKPGSVQRFSLALPAHCEQVDVLGAGTVVGGAYFAARRVPGRQVATFDVHNHAARTGVDAIRVALNGPRELGCDVPVFIR